MAAPAQVTLLGPHGSDPVAHILKVEEAAQFTVGDGIFAGQMARSFIRERTARGIDVNGSPFAGYSTSGPYYLYPNRETGAGPHRATAAKNRAKKTGGQVTPYGVRYDSYAAAKSAHGRSGVDLYGLEQHTHMLDTMLVRCGGAEAAGQSPVDASTNTGQATAFELGFYGPEADRARGNNEGVPSRKLPARRFFDVNDGELAQIGEGCNRRRLARMKAVDAV